MENDFFISYRYETGSIIAGCLFDKLTSYGYKVFYDKEKLESGEFSNQLKNQIESSKYIIVILAPYSFRKKYFLSNDVFIQEIMYAQDKCKNIIPFFVDRFDMSSIPKKIKFLSKLHGVEKANGKAIDNCINDILRISKISEPLNFFLFDHSKEAGKLSDKDQLEIAKEADELMIVNVSGNGYWHTCELICFRPFLQRGKVLRMLCATPESPFIKDIEALESSIGRNRLGEISSEILKHNKTINEYSEYKFNIRFYNTQYRVPFTLAKFPAKDDKPAYCKIWYNITLPPYRASDGKCSAIITKYTYGTEANSKIIELVNACETHFESIWNTSKDAKIYFKESNNFV